MGAQWIRYIVLLCVTSRDLVATRWLAHPSSKLFTRCAFKKKKVVHQMHYWPIQVAGQPIYSAHIGSRISLVLRRLHWLNAAMIHFQTVHLSFSRKMILFGLWTRKDFLYFCIYLWSYVAQKYRSTVSTCLFERYGLHFITLGQLIFIWLEFLIGQSLM